jgi:hypothetical protein
LRRQRERRVRGRTKAQPVLHAGKRRLRRRDAGDGLLCLVGDADGHALGVDEIRGVGKVLVVGVEDVEATIRDATPSAFPRDGGGAATATRRGRRGEALVAIAIVDGHDDSPARRRQRLQAADGTAAADSTQTARRGGRCSSRWRTARICAI